MKRTFSGISVRQQLLGLLAAGLMASTAMPGSAQADVQSGVVKYEAGNFSGAIKDWLPLASANDPNALFNLGQVYRLGRGVAKDMSAARSYYERAARLGHVSAQGNLGTLYFFAEDGALKDQEKAVSWWQEAATNGDARSQYMLGVLFFNGDVVSRDWTRAYAWMGLAASSGLPEASQAETSMLKHMTAAQVADAREISLTLVNPAGAFPNSMPIQFAQKNGAISTATATPVSAVSPAAAGNVVAIDTSASTQKPVEERASDVASAMGETVTQAGTMMGDVKQEELPAPVDVASADAAVPVMDSAPDAPEMAEDTVQDVMAEEFSYKLQLAAFSSEANASSAWDKFSALHGDVLATLSPDVVSADLGARGTIYRLYANGFNTKAAARTACADLEAAGQGCMVVTVK